MNPFSRLIGVVGLLAAFGLAAAQSPELRPRSTNIELRVEATSASIVRSAFLDLGEVVGGRTATGEYIVRLKPGLRIDTVVPFVKRRPGILDVEARPEDIVSQRFRRESLSSLAMFIEAKEELWEKRDRSKEAPREKSETSAHDEAEGAGVDWLEGYLYRRQIQAYPNDFIDWRDIERGVNHVAGMPAGRIVPRRIDEPKDAPGALNLDRTARWEFIGPRNLDIPYRIYYGVGPLAGRINAVEYDPSNPSTIYVGGAQGGIWKTTDGGVNWTPLTDNVLPQISISEIAVRPGNSNEIWIGGGDMHGFGNYSAGVWKSLDAGATWSKVNMPWEPSKNYAIKRIKWPVGTTNTVMVAGGFPYSSDGAVVRSTDNGASFTTVLTGNSWLDLEQSTNNDLWASGWGNNRLFRSTDLGVTWSPVTIGAAGTAFRNLCIATSKLSAGTLYVLDPGYNKIYKTTDSGATFTDISANYGADSYDWSQWWYDYEIATSVAGSQDAVYVQLIDARMSRDGGATFRSIGGPAFSWNSILHNDQHSFSVHPTNPDELLLGCDGGVYRFNYASATDTWTMTSLNRNLGGTTEFYTGAWHPTNPAIMIGGTQDNASPTARGDLNNWVNRTGGDGSGCAINPVNPLIQYGMAQGNFIYRTTDGWATSSGLSSSGFAGSQPFIGKMAIDPNNPNRVYFGSSFLQRWNEDTGTWNNNLGSRDMLGVINAIAVAIGNSNRIVVGTDNGRIWMTTDAGATWRDIRGTTFPNAAVTDISFSATNQTDVLVTVGGFGGTNLIQCSNLDAATPNWVSRMGTGGSALPMVPHNTVTRDPWQATTFYVGNDLGAFMSTDAGNSWTNITAPLGLPNVQVNVLRAIPGTGFLNAATMGRGMWRIRIADATARVSTVSLSPTTISAGQTSTGTVTLTNPALSNMTINLSSTDGGTVPASITIPTGSTSGTFTFTGGMVQTNVTATVTASIVGSSATGSVTVLATRGSSFVSLNAPTTIETGARFPATVRYRNIGSINWTSANGFRLSSINPTGNSVWGSSRLNFGTSESVANGQEKEFAFTGIAPTTPGTYTFDWQMIQIIPIVELFGPATPTRTITVTQVPKSSQFVGQSVPTTVEAGAKFSAQITMRNVGGTAWTQAAGFRLGTTDNSFNVIRSGFLDTETITTGQSKTFTISGTAPLTPGTYPFQWQMLQSGQGYFGVKAPLVNVQVVTPRYGAQFISQSVPTTMTAGQTYTVSITLKNVGTQAWTAASGTRLLSQLPTANTRWGKSQISLSTGESVAPNDNRTFTFTVKAPTTAGTYDFQWRMSQPGVGLFGTPSTNVRVTVN